VSFIIVLDMKEEFTKGQRNIPMADLFSQQTRNQTLSKYQATITRDVSLVVIFVGAISIGISSMITLLISYLRYRKAKPSKEQRRRKWPTYFLFELAWVCALWSIFLLISHIYPPRYHYHYATRISIPPIDYFLNRWRVRVGCSSVCPDNY